MELKPGLKGEVNTVVTPELTTSHIGNGALSVLSTPEMILLMEIASGNAVHPHLPPTQSTVGTVVNIRHLAGTPLGQKVRAESELVEIDRRRLVFRVAAYNESRKIGEGIHERFIIDISRFSNGLDK